MHPKILTSHPEVRDREAHQCVRPIASIIPQTKLHELQFKALRQIPRRVHSLDDPEHPLQPPTGLLNHEPLIRPLPPPHPLERIAKTANLEASGPPDLPTERPHPTAAQYDHEGPPTVEPPRQHPNLIVEVSE